MDKLKVLVLGDGLLCSELVKYTGWGSVSRKQGNFDIDNIAWHLASHNPNVIINCIANTDTYSKDKETHWHLNCRFVSNLVDYCNRQNIKLVHISTDYVYTGSVENATEEDVPVHCNNWYGYTKLIGDGLVQLQSNNYLVIRCTHKPNPFPYDSAWINQIGNFDYVTVISNLIVNMVNNEQTGVINVGSEVKTMHELAKYTKPFVGKSFAPAHVPHDTSMNITKMKNTIK